MMRSRKSQIRARLVRQRKSLSLYLSLFILSVSCLFLHAGEQRFSQLEYKIRAAYLYNFLLLTEWPSESDERTNDRLTLAILGEPEFDQELFRPIAGEEIDNTTIVVKHYDEWEEVADLEGCLLLYVGHSQTKHLSKIVNALRHSPVLLVSDIPGFLRQGGMIQFITVHNTVRFIINKKQIDASGIRISVQLFRVAFHILK